MLRVPRRRTFAVAVLVMLTGCVSPAGTPEATPSPAAAQGLASEDLLFTASVYDYTGSLAGVEVVPADSTEIPLTNPDNEGIASVAQSNNALFVAWIARPCEDRPTLSVRGNPALEITLDRGQPREGVCPSYPHTFAVQLDFETPIEVSEIQLEVQEPDQ